MPPRKTPPVSQQPKRALPRSVHFLGICGRMVGGIALALHNRGVVVTGNDAAPAPPMLDLLHKAGIQVHTGWSAKHLPRDTEAIVVGATIPRRGNPELEAALNGQIDVWNATEFLEHFFLRYSENMVVAGTKGKTTTTAMLTWILESAGLSPDHLIGGQVHGGLSRLKLTDAQHMVIEGDEYWCGLHHPSPKFLRYHPRHVVITNVHFDHGNIFPTQRQYEVAFWQLVNLVPSKGSVTLNADDERSLWLAGHVPFGATLVGFSRRAQRRITRFRTTKSGVQFQLGKQSFQLPLWGRMNASNAALAAVCAEQAGVSLKRSAEALRTFPGVAGRQEALRQVGRSVIYTDEAFHPFALQALIETMRARHPRRRLVLVFQPRYTGGRDGAHQHELPKALEQASAAVIMPSFEMCYADQTFSHRVLCRDLRQHGVEAHAVMDLKQLQRKATSVCRPGDIVIISLSMGLEAAAPGIADAIVQSLQRRATA